MCRVGNQRSCLLDYQTPIKCPLISNITSRYHYCCYCISLFSGQFCLCKCVVCLESKKKKRKKIGFIANLKLVRVLFVVFCLFFFKYTCAGGQEGHQGWNDSLNSQLTENKLILIRTFLFKNTIQSFYCKNPEVMCCMYSQDYKSISKEV